MAREAPEIRLVRETLEGVLHPSTASTVFFEAISEGGGALPTNAQETLALVRGPLLERLGDRIGEPEARTVIDQLERMLIAVGGAPPKRVSRNDEITQNLELSVDVVPVFVLSGTPKLADKLRAVVGPHLLTAVVIGDADTLALRLQQLAPGFVLIDGSEFPAIEPGVLGRTLQRLPAHVIKALWGADLPYGQSVLAEAQQLGFRMTPFDRAEGIEPLIDVIRSRRAAG